MRNKRLLGFVLAILAGLVLGLAYGWWIQPPEPRNADLADLRGDYKADMVLMVAEVYTVDQDLEAARAWLTKLGSGDPNVLVKEALIMAQQMDYSEVEMGDITALLSALENPNQAGAVTP